MGPFNEKDDMTNVCTYKPIALSVRLYTIECSIKFTEWFFLSENKTALGVTVIFGVACVRIVCVPARPCARSVTVRDFVQAQGFLSMQPISGAPATFWFRRIINSIIKVHNTQQRTRPERR